MTRSAIRLVTLTLFLAAPFAAPAPGPALAAGGGGDPAGGDPAAVRTPGPRRRARPAPPKSPRRSPASSPCLDDPAFANGYRAAYATIYDRNDYAAAIEQLKALGHDDHANVANLIGYSYRKLGDYRLSQVWYERALKVRSEPRADLAVLRPVADRTGQPRSGAVSSEPDRARSAAPTASEYRSLAAGARTSRRAPVWFTEHLACEVCCGRKRRTLSCARRCAATDRASCADRAGLRPHSARPSDPASAAMARVRK